MDMDEQSSEGASGGTESENSEVNHHYDILVQCGVEVIDGLSREPKDFAVVLHSKGFIATQILQEIVEIPATSTENARKLYTALLDVVEHYPHRYKEFISILQDNTLLYGDLLTVLGEDLNKNDSTSQEQSSLSLPQPPTRSAVPTLHGDPTSTPHDDPTSTPHGDPTLSPHGDPTLSPHGDPTLSPHGDPTSTPHDAVVRQSDLSPLANLPDRVKQLEDMFSKLARDTFKRLLEMKVDINDFYGQASSMDVSLGNVAGNFFEDCFARVSSTSNMAIFWGKLNRFWNFYNFELLHHIIQTMFDEVDDSLLRKVEDKDSFIKKVDGLRKAMQTYKKEITEFSSKTKVCDFFRIWPFRMEKPEEVRVRKVILKVKKCWEECTLLDIKETSNTLAQTFFLPRHLILICNIEEGSVSILFYAPPSVAGLLEKGVSAVKPGFLLANGFQSISIDDVQVYPLTTMGEYSLYIQRLYETKQQPLSSSKPSTDKFIVPFKLAKIEKEEVHRLNRDKFTKRSLRGDKDDIWFKKSPTDLDSVGILPDGSPARLVLIEGAPGVGKTTLSWKVCQMWGRGEILQNISTLVLLPLRDHGLKEIANLEELLAHTKPGAESLVKEIEANKGEGLAFWLDGWDEIASTLDGPSSIYERLVSGVVLPKATVIVSSRPWATNYIKQQLDKQPSQHIEIIASVHDQIEYLLEIEKKHPSSKYSSGLAQFLDYLDTTPAIRAAMHTPMATRITLEVFHWSQETGSPLPSTVTDLYTAYICLLVHTHLDNHPLLGLKSWKSDDFKDIPEPVNKMFIGLCQLAYEGLLDGQRLVFPDLPKHLKHLQLETLGLMQAQAPLYASEDSAVLSYHYNHLTVQEFLSAYYILQLELTEEEKSEICLKFNENDHFTLVMRFLSGQTESTYIPHHVMRRMIAPYNDKDQLTLFHWLFEGGESAPVADVLGDSEIRVRSDYTWTTLDYYVTGCVIDRSNCIWDVDFYSAHMGDEWMEVFIRGLCTTSEVKLGNGHIRSIDLKSNDLSSQSLSHLVDMPAHILRHLKKINLGCNKLDRADMDHIAKIIPYMPELEVLDLEYNNGISRGDAVTVVSALCDHKMLKELNLSTTNIGEEDCQHIATLLSCSRSLEKLDISNNALTSDNIHIIFNGLHQNSTLKHLGIGSMLFTDNPSRISLDNMKSLCVYLQDRGKCKLEALKLRFCHINPESAVELAHGLSQNCSVKTLNLSNNPVGDEGATALGQALVKNKTLTDLNLGMCETTTTGGTALATSLLENTTLDTLNIKRNALGGGEAIETFAKVLQQNKTLKRLVIYDDETLSQSDVSTLLSSLSNNQTLKTLALPKKFKVATDQRVVWW